MERGYIGKSVLEGKHSLLLLMVFGAFTGVYVSLMVAPISSFAVVVLALAS